MAAELDMSEMDEEFYKNLLLAAGKDSKDAFIGSDQPEGTYVTPEPGFVIKTKNDKNEKIFLNICTSDELPPPRDISEEELTKLLDDQDAMNFRVPIGLGNPHAEIDKSGNGCTVYDVVINTTFYSKLRKSNFLMGFFMTVVYEGLEDKYALTLSRNWVTLKNRRCIGQIVPQRIRAKSKPVIQEMDNPNSLGLKEVSTKLVSQTTKDVPSAAEPPYKIICEPPQGQVEYLVIEISLPNVKSMRDTSLDVGDDRLILNVRPNKYYLDLKLPHVVDYESGGAQFDRRTKVLTVTIPVLQSTTSVLR